MSKIEEQIRKQWFGDFKIGTRTNHGIIDDLYFLKFEGACGARKMYTPEGGKGLLIAQIGKKAHSIGNLTIEL